MTDRWLETGDLAMICEDGAVRILGRNDDRITLSTGYKVDPLQIELLLKKDSRIQQVCLVGENRPYAIGIVSIDPSINMLEATEMQLDWQQMLIEASIHSSVVPKHWIVTSEQWSANSGFLNHKGAVCRKRVQAHYSELIDQKYSSFSS